MGAFKDLVLLNSHSISQPMPGVDGSPLGDVDWWFHVERSDAFLHPSWIIDEQTVLSDLWNLGQLGVDTAQTIKDIWDWFHPQGQITPAVIKAVADALQQDGDNQGGSNTIRVPWQSLDSCPFATNSLTNTLGVKGDMLLCDTIRSVAPNKCATDGHGNLIVDAGSSELLLTVLPRLHISTQSIWPAPS